MEGMDEVTFLESSKSAALGAWRQVSKSAMHYEGQRQRPIEQGIVFQINLTDGEIVGGRQ
jgi:hypothetical protein